MLRRNIMKRKLRFFGHVMRQDGLERTNIIGKLTIKIFGDISDIHNLHITQVGSNCVQLDIRFHIDTKEPLPLFEQSIDVVCSCDCLYRWNNVVIFALVIVVIDVAVAGVIVDVFDDVVLETVAVL
ncbi:Hypothetical predicted protein [Octopus vulgaris]|uniref:Uncharacterized protein n=1 Tax=Octopus vulgaris TaxID=6645 RepID=A0AA36B0Q1_OCTVU|nr:Hypothetical predicted protein [Octopus vulgaris]